MQLSCVPLILTFYGGERRGGGKEGRREEGEEGRMGGRDALTPESGSSWPGLQGWVRFLAYFQGQRAEVTFWKW